MADQVRGRSGEDWMRRAIEVARSRGSARLSLPPGYVVVLDEERAEL